ncbi:hypothetical protein KSC48_14545, partial [Staphylococcus aureus]|nr:hypothetical protein [Staphylococcus aureus]MBU7940828.1 hypothetical protein [Staphylococcus aureus]
CQFFFSRLKIQTNAGISRFISKFKKDSYFYIVSRQEETRFHSFQKPQKTGAYFQSLLLYSNCFLVGTNRALCVVELVLSWE